MNFFLTSLSTARHTLLSYARLIGIMPSIPTAFTTQILPCDPASIFFPSNSDQPEISSPKTISSLALASQHLLSLQCVAFPTETVYGLGALALDTLAASRIYSTKGRPPDNPLIVHVSSFAMLRTLLPKNYVLSEAYEVLMKHFWPGALTLLFPSDPNKVPGIITSNQPTVAIRMPSHPVARALIAATNVPIAAPSANSSGKPSPTKAEHVQKDLNGKVAMILDGGACGLGVESTVLDGLNEDGNLRVLRPGGVTVEEIERALKADIKGRIPKVLVHKRDYRDDEIEMAPTTPGMKGEPTLASAFFASLSDRSTDASRPLKIGILTPSDSSLATYPLPTQGTEWRVYPLGPTSDPSITAHRLFDGFLTLESEGVDLILIEEVKEDNEGLAIMNRVRKAASESRWVRL